MLEIINSMVLIVFGILIGLLTRVAGAYDPLIEEKRKAKDLTQRDGESFFDYLRRTTSEEYRNEDDKIKESMPKPYQRALTGTGVFVIMLVVVLIFSPLYMNWLIFIGSILAGIIIYELIFYLAKAGKIKVVGDSFLDIPKPGKPSLNTKEDQPGNINI